MQVTHASKEGERGESKCGQEYWIEKWKATIASIVEIKQLNAATQAIRGQTEGRR